LAVVGVSSDVLINPVVLPDLKAQYGDAATNKSGSARDSLKNLSALLTLARAKQLGFDPQKYDLSEKQAANIALVSVAKNLPCFVLRMRWTC
jgi:hypothetical protein